MSFHYLFKFIVIGDTGKQEASKVSASPASCSSSSNKK
jgi:hypothetical protein